MAGNLELITSIEVTSSTSSVNIDNVFTDKYDVYSILVTDFETVGSTQTALHLRYIDSSGSIISGSTYDYAYLQMDVDTTFSEIRSTTATSLKFNEVDIRPEGAGFQIYIYNPFSSSFTFATWQTASYYANKLRGTKGVGVEHTAQSHRGFQLFEIATRPFDKGKVSVFGLASN